MITMKWSIECPYDLACQLKVTKLHCTYAYLHVRGLYIWDTQHTQVGKRDTDRLSKKLTLFALFFHIGGYRDWRKGSSLLHAFFEGVWARMTFFMTVSHARENTI